MLAHLDAAPGAREAQEAVRELKYVLPAAYTSALAAGLAAFLRPDPRYPDNQVVSVYFDTPDLDSIAEKINGDSRKRKLRLRWYEPARGAGPASPAFLELKLRHGELRWKVRAEVEDSERPWRRDLPLEHPAWVDLPRRLAPETLRLPAGMVAVAVVRYHRRRFIDAASASRVALDSGIRATAWHRGLLPGLAPRPLADSVLEVKSSAEPAGALRFLIERFGCRRSAFSKYTAALGLH